MILKYEFEDTDYEFEPEEYELKEALIKALCHDCKITMGVFYNEAGAEQMANYIVYNLEAYQELSEMYEDILTEHFEKKAYEDYLETKQEEAELNSWYGTKSNIVGRS